MTDSDWWTTTDVATYLGVRANTISAYRIRGQMPKPARRIGRTWVWRPAAIQRWHRDRPRPGIGGRPVSESLPPAEGGPRMLAVQPEIWPDLLRWLRRRGMGVNQVLDVMTVDDLYVMTPIDEQG